MKTRVPPKISISTKLFFILTLMLVAAFVLIAWINTGLYLNLCERNVYDHAFQVSDVIKSSTRYSMLKNHREDLANTIANIGQEKGIEGIWIYDKLGVVHYASDIAEVSTELEKDAEQCVFCHSTEQAKGTIPKRNRIRHLASESGERTVGLINPIENSPSCYVADCHAHGEDEKILGLIDIKMSLGEVDRSIARTRNTVLLLSAGLILITAWLFRELIRRIIYRPISKLVHATEKVAAMDLDYQAPVFSHDELGYLSDSFNKMTKKLKGAMESEREKNEELERTQEHIILVEKMASLGKLAAVVAHEINNPMAGILTYSKLSMKQLSGTPSAKEIEASIENMKMIGSEAKRCGDMVKNLLLFSKKRYEQMSKHDIRPIIDRSVELAWHSIKNENISLDKEIVAKNTDLVCDPTDIQQMLLIFLINATEAVPKDGGKILVRLLEIDDGRKLRFEVIDNGVGISKEDQMRIFEPFYTTKENAENTGVGLAVAYRIIVNRHGGEISLESIPNKGTTFYIDLPVDGPAVNSAKTEADEYSETQEVV
jgi:two-component system NtrC family sensor kinase